MRPNRYFLVPLAMLAGLSLLLIDRYGQQWIWLLLLAAAGVVTVLIFSPQIDWWYWQRRAPDLPGGLRALLEKRVAFYQRLEPLAQREFRRRAFLLRESLEFTGQAIEKIPDDVQLLPALAAATISFGREEFLFPAYERVVLYPHPFPSPQHDFLHVTERYAPDGVLLFSMPHLMRSVVEEQSFPNLALYEYAKIYRERYPEEEYPELDWPQLEAISTFRREAVTKFLGFEEPDLQALTSVFFFSFSARFREQAPAVYRTLCHTFALDPLAPKNIFVTS
jgi:hypothetical protein